MTPSKDDADRYGKYAPLAEDLAQKYGYAKAPKLQEKGEKTETKATVADKVDFAKEVDDYMEKQTLLTKNSLNMLADLEKTFVNSKIYKSIKLMTNVLNNSTVSEITDMPGFSGEK